MGMRMIMRTIGLFALALGLQALAPVSAMATPLAHGGCNLNAVVFKTSDTVATIGANGSTAFAAIPDSAIRFVQRKAGCVTVSFLMDLFLAAARFNAEAVMDSAVVCSPGETRVAEEFAAELHSVIEFICPDVAPGAHVIRMRGQSLRTLDPNLGSTEVRRRMLLVHYFR